jgi:hypothetical protein
MTETTQTLRDDIAFMRALADEGVRPPLVAGPWLIVAGAIWSAAPLAAWYVVKIGYAPFWWSNLPFAIGAVISLIFMPFLRARSRRAAGANSPANRAVAVAWSGVGGGIYLYVACTFLTIWQSRSGAPMLMMPSVVMVLYGVAWAVSAAMTKDRLLWVVTLTSYAAALAMALFAASQDLLLFFAIAIFITAFVPGVILWRREPKAVV